MRFPFLMKIYFYNASLVLLFTASIVQAQVFPVNMKCSEVSSNGDVTIYWQPSQNTIDLQRYEIYYSFDISSSFNLIANISDLGITQYQHIGANANVMHAYYFVKTITTNGLWVNSDTIASILPVGSIVNQTYIQLQWNALMKTLPSSNDGLYRIFYREENEDWIKIDSTSGLSYIHDVRPCVDRYYKIEMYDEYCKSVSAIVKVDHDIVQPPTPIFDSVSVVNGQIHLGWQKVNAPDVEGYIVYLQDQGIWDTLALIPNFNTTHFIDALNDPSAQSWKYSVAAYDFCGNVSEDMGIPQAQNSIWLNEPAFDVCEGRIRLQWTPYANLSGGLEGYTIYLSENNEAFYPFVHLNASTLTYDFLQAQDKVKYSFFIRANSINPLISASSNVRSLHVRMPPQPQYAYIRYGTVVNNQFIALKFLMDSLSPIQKFFLERSTNQSANFTQIKEFMADDANLYFVDSAVNVSKNQYHYRLRVIDSCGAEALVSNLASNILLKNPHGSQLQWNKYKDWFNGPEGYMVYKIVNVDTTLVAELSPEDTTWSDADIDHETGAMYFIRAIEASGNPFSLKETSQSNTVVIEPDYHFFIPNAFTPFRNTTNHLFKPLLTAIDPTEYYFAVFSRIGQKIFETHSPDEGWDGTYKGKKVESGVYVYYIRLLTSKGRYIDKSGSFVLLD